MIDQKDIDSVFVQYVKEYQGMYIYIYTQAHRNEIEFSSLSLSLNTCIDINGTYVQVYEKPPTALEFLRGSVQPNRPAVIKGIWGGACKTHYTRCSYHHNKAVLNIGQQERVGQTNTCDQRWGSRQ